VGRGAGNSLPPSREIRVGLQRRKGTRMKIKIAPSIMVSDLTRLAESVHEVEDGGAAVMHVDVMDGHFVPSMQAGTTMVSAVKQCARAPVEAHLMVDNPGEHIDDFAEAGADIILIHTEVVDDPAPLLHRIREHGCWCGVSIKPQTGPDAIEPLADKIDSLLVMTVEPGYSGQSFMESAADKIPALREMLGPDVDIGVDGGIKPETAPAVVRRGANLLVAGSAVFRADVSPAEAVQRLQRVAEEAMTAGDADKDA